MEPSTTAVNSGALVALAVFVAKEVFLWFKGSAKENVKMIHDASLNIVEIKVRLEYMSKQLEKINRDVDHAHTFIRDIKDKSV